VPFTLACAGKYRTKKLENTDNTETKHSKHTQKPKETRPNDHKNTNKQKTRQIP